MCLGRTYSDSTIKNTAPVPSFCFGFIFLSGILSGIEDFQFRNGIGTGLKARFLQGLVLAFRTIYYPEDRIDIDLW